MFTLSVHNRGGYDLYCTVQYIVLPENKAERTRKFFNVICILCQGLE